jgi:signal peptidase I
MNIKEGLIYFSNIAYELGKWAFLVLVLGTIVHYFLATVFVISGPSMEPEFHDGQIVIVSRIGLFSGKYSRGDPMVIKFPGDPDSKKYIKRLVALPQEKIQIKNNEVFINDKKIYESYVRPVDEIFLPYYYENPEWEEEARQLHSQGKVLTKPDLIRKLDDKEYFLMGDNRENSNDSRKWYPAGKSDLIGPVVFILGQIKTDPDCIGFCIPKLSLDGWGPVVSPYYSGQ